MSSDGKLKFENRNNVIKEDCISCKIVGGVGLLTGGSYILYNAKYAKNSMGRTLSLIFGLGLSGLGIARFADLWPFNR